MPIYEYKCANGHVFDAFQKMSDEPLEACQDCGAPAQRVLHPVAIHFKGSGFHNTDYKTKRGNGASSEASKDSGEPKKSESSESGGSESKSSDSKSSGSKATAGS